jgi:hypothetical protein
VGGHGKEKLREKLLIPLARDAALDYQLLSLSASEARKNLFWHICAMRAENYCHPIPFRIQ